MSEKDTIFWVWFSLFPSLRQKAKVALLNEYGSPENIWKAVSASTISCKGITEGDKKLLASKGLNDASEVLLQCGRQNIDIICFNSPQYPERLKNIYCPPAALYVKGALPCVDELPVISVIGTRKASDYGIKMGKQLAYDISQSGATVVSLLTAGIDSASAEGALLSGKGCIGVLGTPHENEKSPLAKEVVSNGALISEYPPSAGKSRSFFRERNRIAAGLSIGVVVVEAPEKSGTAYFVSEALDQGKDIFAVPGNADSENSAGTLHLLKLGATPVGNGWDVLSGYTDRYPFLQKSLNLIPDIPARKEKSVPEGLPKKKSSPSGKQVQDTGSVDWLDSRYGLSDDQKKVVTVLKKGPGSVDSIITLSGLSASKVLSQLTILEIKGVVCRNAAKIYQLATEKK